MTFLRAFGNDRRGVAAVEAALIGGFLVVAMFNVAEVSRYAYISMQVLTASQAGAQAATAQSSLAAGTDWQNLQSRTQLEQGSVKLM